MKQSTLMAVILAVLVILSGVQAYQVTALKTEISDAQFTLGSSSSSSRVTLTTPASLNELPTMVGGC